jgi:anaerobic C4-dicarboxylate transporter
MSAVKPMRSSVVRFVLVILAVCAISSLAAAGGLDETAQLGRVTARQSQSAILIGLGLAGLAVYGRRNRTAGL